MNKLLVDLACGTTQEERLQHLGLRRSDVDDDGGKLSYSHSEL